PASPAARDSGVACSMVKDGAVPLKDRGTCAQYSAFTAPALRKFDPDSTTPSRYSFTRRCPKALTHGSMKDRLKLGFTSSIPASSIGAKNPSATDSERRAADLPDRQPGQEGDPHPVA